MLKSRKHVFWEAFFVTVVIFIFGILLGVAFEASKLDEVNRYYAQSEISLMDVIALNKIIESENPECSVLIKENVDFADRIYGEAGLLEKYEDSGKITEGMKLAHKKYDLLRTFLWMSSTKSVEKCGDDFDLVVYLYEYETKDLVEKATNAVWSRVLFGLKSERGGRIILIPIAVDSDLVSLNALISKYEISDFPVVIINNKVVVEELTSVEEIKRYLAD